MKTRGTLWPSDSTISGCVKAAWITKPIRVRVSKSHKDSSMNSATSIMKPRVAGKVEHTKRTLASAALHISAGALPHTKLRPSTEWLIKVKAELRKISGGGNSTAERPQTSCTSSSKT